MGRVGTVLISVLLLAAVVCSTAAVTTTKCQCGCASRNASGGCAACAKCAATNAVKPSSLRQVSRLMPRASAPPYARAKSPVNLQSTKYSNQGLGLVGGANDADASSDDGENSYEGGEQQGPIDDGSDGAQGGEGQQPDPSVDTQVTVTDCAPAALGCYTGKTCNNCQCCRGYMGGCWKPGTPFLSFAEAYYC